MYQPISSGYNRVVCYCSHDTGIIIQRQTGRWQSSVMTELRSNVTTDYLMYCRTRFDSEGLMTAKIVTKNDRYRWNSL